MRAVVALVVLVLPAMAGCVQVETDRPEFRTPDDVDPIERPTPPAIEEPDQDPAPSPTPTPNEVNLGEGATSPLCPEATGTGPRFMPTADAPHSVQYSGPMTCLHAWGLSAQVSGESLTLTPDPNFPTPALGMLGGDITVTLNGSMEQPERVFLLEPTEWTGNMVHATHELHRIDPTFRETIRFLTADANLQEGLAPSLTGTLDAEALIRLPDGREGIAGLHLDGTAYLQGLGTLQVTTPDYTATGSGVVALQGVRLDVAGKTFHDAFSLRARSMDLTISGGTLALTGSVDQVWQDSAMLLATLHAEEYRPGMVLLREDSGKASLEGVQVTLDGPGGLRPFRKAPDSEWEDWQAFTLRVFWLLATRGFGTFWEPEFVSGIPTEFYLDPGDHFYIPVERTGDGPVTVHVTTENGGTWETELPL